ncbi:Fanconi anemia group D2 protein homolog [Drosophila takahashii]|uniref:Fanconi anemia group D2 protein homolog n=1 Tax=Drosophila takahashii TaxID=29030 RepID=UPI001CF8EF8D|nr:Fanconi anemia group D2 protein [Drosophila takahashii]
MYKRFKKRTQKALNTIDENTTIKVSRLAETTTNVSVESAASGSEENIPASQEHTQRFLSQHSAILAATLGRTQSSSRNIATLSRQPNNFFELVLIRAGVQLDQGDSLVLSCDHVSIVSKLRDIFMSASSYTDKLETFKTGLNAAMAPSSKLVQKLLTGCTVDAAGEEQIYQSQNSMFMNFLMIDFMRDPCVEVLLNKIEEVATADRVVLGKAAIPMPLLPLMLTQLRYLTVSHKVEIYGRIEGIFNRATESAKLDIIANAELILDASMHDEFVELLNINYSSTEDLFQMTTVQTLSNLSLSDRTQAKLRLRILEFATNGHCPDTTLPHLIRLLLNILKMDTDDSVRDLIGSLREMFNWRHTAHRDENSATTERKKSQLELFGFLELGLIRSKRFYQAFQRSSASLSAEEFTSFDLIVLLLLIHVNEDNSLYIENILRRRIKLEHITVNILEEVRLHYRHILEQHISPLMNILHDFMREKNRTVSDFAKSSYSILFKIFNSIQKNILKKLLELTCDKSSPHLTTMALELLRELQRKSAKDVQNCATLLIPMLDRISDLTLTQTRVAMDLLCHVAFPDPKLSACLQLQEQVDMVVKKQLINSTDNIKKQGIIGCVQLIDAMARIENNAAEHDDSLTSVENVDSLPDGRGKMAANLIIRTESSIGNSVESLALFYEELATVFNQRNDGTSACDLDYHFIAWACDVVTFRFQASFVTEDVPETIKGIKLEYQMNINELDDTNANTESDVLNIGINISKLVLSPKAKACDSIYVLAPLFNCVRVLYKHRHHDSLEGINALLGCAIVLPSFFEDDNYLAVFDNFEAEQQKDVLSIYFHTVNWMRVSISAFASQRDPATRRRVLSRLGELIRIEQRIKPLLARAPIDFVAPPYQFLTNAKHSVVGQKRQGAKAAAKFNATAAEPDLSGNQTSIADFTIKVGPCKAIKTKIDFEQMYGPRERYRPMEVEIIMLLVEQKFVLNHQLEKEQVGEFLGLQELRFLLEDMVQKLEAAVLRQQDSSDADSFRPHLAKPEDFICDLLPCLHEVNNHLSTLAEAIDKELTTVNHVYSNLDLFKEQFNYIKTCFGLCVRLFALYFAWSEWADKSQAELLHKSLLKLQPKAQWKKLEKQTVPQLATLTFQYFLKYEKSVLNLSTAVQLHRLLGSLLKVGSSQNDASQPRFQQAEELRLMCGKLLRRKWFHYSGTLDKGGQCNIYLDELVKGFLKKSTTGNQTELLNELVKQCSILNTKDKALSSFPNFKKANFPLLFRGLCEVLIHSLSGQVSVDKRGDRLKLWESTVELLNGLLSIVQQVEQPRNFGLFLKHSLLFLKLLLQHGMSALESIVRDDPERLIRFLHELQKVTRFLHQLCCHSKTIKITAIISYIPSLRETIETLVFRVKALLAANNCHSAFHMGNMINRDLHGDSIITPSSSFVDEENSDEEIPADDTSVDETVLGDDMGITTASVSTRPSDGSRRSKSSSRSKCF